MTRALIASVLFTAARAYAQDPPSEPATPVDDHSADEVADAPLPGDESGRTDDGEHDSTLRNIGQGVLFVPKLVLQATFAPVRGGLWAYGHFGIGGRIHRATWDATDTYGIYPTLYVDSDYGATVGARFVHRNLFGAHEKLSLRAAFGGEFNEHGSVGVKTGERFGKRTQLELVGELEQRPHDPFYGIGNNGDVPEVTHRQQLERMTATLDTLNEHYVHVRAAAALTDLEYGAADDGTAIDMTYPGQLTGWTGTRNVYGELELRYDSRRISPTLEQQGVLVDGFAGRVHQLEAGNDYWRYGGEVIHFQPLGVGRTLATRLHLESVTGGLEDVAFTQLPQLGGKALLRGYPVDRFRDRAAALGSAEYMWDLSSFLLASVFVDVGRVYPDIRDVSFDDLRMGYGASLQLVDHRRFLAGVSAASSIDGGLFLNLVLDPIYEPEPRVRQK